MELTWGIAGLSLLATVANIYKRRWCFWIWAGTNAAWTIIDWDRGIHAQAALQAIYFGLAIWGIVKWRKS